MYLIHRFARNRISCRVLKSIHRFSVFFRHVHYDNRKILWEMPAIPRCLQHSKYSCTSDKDAMERLSVTESKFKQLGIVNFQDVQNVIENFVPRTSELSEDNLFTISELVNATVLREAETPISLVEKYNILIKSLKDGQLTGRYFYKYLEVLANACGQDSFKEVHVLMNRHNIEISSDIARGLLKAFVHSPKTDDFESVLSLVETGEVLSKIEILNFLIARKGVLKDIEAVEQIRNQIEAERYGNTKENMVTLVTAYHRCGVWHRSKAVVEELQHKGVKLSSEHVRNVLTSCVENGLFQTHLHYLRYIINWVLSMVRETDMKLLTLKLIHGQYLKEAYEVFIRCPSNFRDPHLNSSGYWFIETLVKLGQNTTDILEICSDLFKKGVNENVLSLALEVSLVLGREELAWKLLDLHRRHGADIKEHYFWPLLCLKRDNRDHEDVVINILSRMTQLGVTLSNETLSTYAIPHLPFDSPEIAFMMLQKCSVSRSKAITPLLVVMISNNMLDESSDLVIKSRLPISTEVIVKPLARSYLDSPDKALRLFADVLANNSDCDFWKDSQNEPPIGDLFKSRILRNVAPENKESVMEALFKNFEKFGIPYSSNPLNELSEPETGANDTISRTDPPNKTKISMPQEKINVDELESHLIELRSKNMNTRGVLRKLLIKYSANKDVKNISRILNELKKIEGKFSPGMLSSNLNKFIVEKNFEGAFSSLLLLEQHFPAFKVDSFKIVDLCKLLIKHDEIEEALNVMKNYVKKTDKSFHNKKAIQRNCFELLSTMADRNIYPEITEMTSLLIDGGLASPNPVTLGPILKYHLNSDNLSDIVERAESLYNTYGVLPMRIEILVKILTQMFLLDDGDKRHRELSQMLSRISEMIKISRGSNQMKQDLLYATLETGNEKEARDIFLSVEKSLQVERVKVLCNFLARHEKTACLLLLFSVTRGSHRVNRSYICEVLLNIYYVRREREAAMELWSEMTAERLRPSTIFMEKMSKLLGSSAEPIPFSSDEPR